MRALLIAGITGMVRQILIVTIPATYAMQVFATGALYAVLIAGVVLVVPTHGHIHFSNPTTHNPIIDRHRMRVFMRSRTNHWFMEVIH